MSSPTRLSKSPVGIREGTRVILREITASLHNSPPAMSPGKKPVSDPTKLPEHEVKVKFAREFTDAPHPPETASISSASSFQSLTSTVSSKSSLPTSPTRTDTSYTNPDVSGLDDLISACAGIRLEDTLIDQSLVEASFTSASDELIINRTTDFSHDAIRVLESDLNGTQLLSDRSSPLIPTPDLSEHSTIKNPDARPISPNVTITHPNDHLNSLEYKTATESLLQTSPSAASGRKTPEVNETNTATSIADSTYQKIGVCDLTFASEGSSLPTLPTLPSICLESSEDFKEPFPVEDLKPTSVSPEFQSNQPDEIDQTGQSSVDESVIKEQVSISVKIPDTSGHISTISEPTFFDQQKDLDNSKQSSIAGEDPKEQSPSIPDSIVSDSSEKSDQSEILKNAESSPETISEDPEPPKTLEAPLEETSDPEELDRTITLPESDNLSDIPESEQYEAFKPQRQSTESHPRPFPPIPTPSDYTNFLPHRQSTGLSDFLPPPNDFQSSNQPEQQEQSQEQPSFDHQTFYETAEATEISAQPSGVYEKLRLGADAIIHEIINASLEDPEDDNIATATSNELFKDPSTFDFFESQTSAKSSVDRLRESLFIKFDPLVSNVSMLPQGNMASPPDERNGVKDSETSITTPKRNPAIAAIDRLLFYSPMPASTIREEVEKLEEKAEPVPVVDSAMAKELALVRSTVLQLEEQLEKEKVERERERKEAEKQREMVTQLQKQLAQEIKSKNQINVVVDEYEKSISRLVAERERDKKSLDGEKSVLVEELQETKDHLMASEAAFNDVHAKYERLKVVVTTLRSNEGALRESLAENVEIIKALENRYDQIKIHAGARLEKANQDLNAIRKQHESEMVKLRAILRKEELKSNSLTELVEQKTKENKELTQILDEVIARVGAKSDD